VKPVFEIDERGLVLRQDVCGFDAEKKSDDSRRILEEVSDD